MNTRRDGAKELLTVAALLAALCCVVPALAAAGFFAALAGIGLRNWFLVLAGLLIATAGALRWRRRRTRRCP